MRERQFEKLVQGANEKVEAYQNQLLRASDLLRQAQKELAKCPDGSEAKRVALKIQNFIYMNNL